jgi:hypothetical protein
MTAKLKAKRTWIATIQYLCLTYATFLNPLGSHYRARNFATSRVFLLKGTTVFSINVSPTRSRYALYLSLFKYRWIQKIVYYF